MYSVDQMKHLSQCLDSVQWADAVTVRHLDRETRAVSNGEVGHPSEGLGTDWVLHLWGEERVETELSDELRQFCQSEPEATLPAYLIPIRSRLLGRWVDGSLWGPTPAPRLCRHIEQLPSGWWSLTRRTSQGTSGLLHGWIGDYSCAELGDGVDQVNRVSSFWAGRLRSEGRSLSTVAVAVYPLWVLLRLLFINRLFLEGLAGLSLSALAAYATLASGMKLWDTRARCVL